MERGDAKMKERTIYVPADSEDYTGYTTHTLMSTSTSEVATFTLTEDKVVYEPDLAPKERAKEFDLPETREERFLDKNLQEFYNKKGYNI